MPCNSDHMRQTPFEAGLQLAARLSIHLASKVGIDLPEQIRAADTYYSTDVGQTEWLCENLGRRVDQLELDIHDANDRALIAWWEDHQIVDQVRERREDLKKQALAKLSPEERQALGL